MSRIAGAAIVLIGLLLPVGPAVGQQSSRVAPPEPGEPIRVTTDSTDAMAGYISAPLRWRHGTLDSIGTTHIWMQTRDGHLSVPLNVVKTLQVRRERRSALAVLSSGTLAGAALGTFWVLLAPPREWAFGVEHLVAPFAALGFGISLVMLPAMTEGWQSVPAAATNGLAPGYAP